MNYIAADCNLTKYQLGNIDQQEKVGSDANTHVVAYVDVGNQHHTYGNWKDCRAYYVTKDNTPGKLKSEVVGEFGKTDMSKPQTLTKFIVDAMGKFPADHVCRASLRGRNDPAAQPPALRRAHGHPLGDARAVGRGACAAAVAAGGVSLLQAHRPPDQRNGS